MKPFYKGGTSAFIVSLPLHVIQKLGDNAKDQTNSVIYSPKPMVSNYLKVDAIKLRERGMGRKLWLRLLYKKQIGEMPKMVTRENKY